MKQLKSWIGVIFLVVGLTATGAEAQSGAAAYPTRPVRMIVPYPAGGTTDLIA